MKTLWNAGSHMICQTEDVMGGAGARWAAYVWALRSITPAHCAYSQSLGELVVYIPDLQPSYRAGSLDRQEFMIHMSVWVDKLTWGDDISTANVFLIKYCMLATSKRAYAEGENMQRVIRSLILTLGIT
jgi:hypothetical protein